MRDFNAMFAADIAWARHRYIVAATRTAVEAGHPADVIEAAADAASVEWAREHPQLAARMPWTHPALHCDMCAIRQASLVVETWDSPDERTYQLVCERTLCLSLASGHAEANGIHVDLYPLGSRAEAEQISGLDLAPAS